MNVLRFVESDFWRNRDGSIVHTNDCIYSGSKGAHPWVFVEGWDSREVVALVERTPWLRCCSKCFTPPGDTDE